MVNNTVESASAFLPEADDPATADQTYSARLSRHAESRADHCAVVLLRLPEGSRGDTPPVEYRMTYRDLDTRTRALASRLQDLCGVGDRAMLVYPTGDAFVIAFLACLRAGVVAVPVPAPEAAQSGDARRSAVLKDCGARTVLTDSEHFAAVRSWLESTGADGRTEVVATDQIVAPRPDRPDRAVKASDLAFLQYTSGSTSEPKGVMVSHGNLLHNQRQLVQALVTDEGLVLVAWLPMFHDMGLIGALMHPLYVGGTVVLMDPATFLRHPALWLWAIDRYRGSLTVGPNFAYRLVSRRAPRTMPDYDLSCLRVALSGAEPVEAATIRQFVSRFAPVGLAPTVMLPCYGLAEATLFVTGHAPATPSVTTTFRRLDLEGRRLVPRAAEQPPDPQAAATADVELVSCGTAVDSEVAIVDPDTCRPVAAGGVGEVWVRGQNVAQGYWGKAAGGDDVFGATTAEGRGPFLRTGDLGGFHEGNLYITGRIKDMMIVNGRNIYPQDIEAVAARAHPTLATSTGAAFSPPGRPGQVCLAMELRTAPEQPVPVTDLIDRIRLAVWQETGLQLADVTLVERGSIPRTTSGKVRRAATADLFEAGGFTPLV